MISQALHDLVLRRDGACFGSRVQDHVCRDQWGVAHAATDLGRLTLDHVHAHAGGTKGKRAPDDAQHLVAMCAKLNIDGPSREIRTAARAYLRDLYPA